MSAPGFAGARWRKSTRSNAQTACVEVAASTEGQAGVRDSKLSEGRSPILAFDREQWASFVGALKSGELDLR